LPWARSLTRSSSTPSPAEAAVFERRSFFRRRA
jgi:hypothetical protein